MKSLSKMINDCITGPDGTTIDPARILWIIGIISFLFFTGHYVYRGNTFDMVNFGIAFSSLLVAGGIGVKVKETTEPQALSTPPSTPTIPVSVLTPPPPLSPVPTVMPNVTPAPAMTPCGSADTTASTTTNTSSSVTDSKAKPISKPRRFKSTK